MIFLLDSCHGLYHSHSNSRWKQIRMIGCVSHVKLISNKWIRKREREHEYSQAHAHRLTYPLAHKQKRRQSSFMNWTIHLYFNDTDFRSVITHSQTPLCVHGAVRRISFDMFIFQCYCCCCCCRCWSNFFCSFLAFLCFRSVILICYIKVSDITFGDSIHAVCVEAVLFLFRRVKEKWLLYDSISLLKSHQLCWYKRLSSSMRGGGGGGAVEEKTPNSHTHKKKELRFYNLCRFLDWVQQSNIDEFDTFVLIERKAGYDFDVHQSRLR